MNYKSAFLLRCPAIPKVRIALVGLGNRGTKTLVRYAFIDNAEISCIVDVDSQRLARANKLLRDSGRKERSRSADLMHGRRLANCPILTLYIYVRSGAPIPKWLYTLCVAASMWL